ncbi:membrane attack complex component perforin [Fusarium globosum]|uniref:Membrane attack complex component perforin n=1 Tax=Fusarium globosum TaxID=78864 RepID=A0A8H5YE62_9HYPO|nr:membrane attack complex component perforin [Fusarium globosum]
MSLNLQLKAPHLPGHQSSATDTKPPAADGKPSAADASKPDTSQAWTSSTVAPLPEEEAVMTTIHFTDGVNEKEAFYLKLLKSNLDDETLSDLRSCIAGLTGSIEISHFPFCGKKGAIVPDTFSVQDYLTECLGIKTSEAKTLDVYMKHTSTSPKLDTGELCEALGIDKFVDLKHQVGDVAFKWITGTQAKYVPELEQRDWAIISESNALCYGIRVIRVKDPSSNPGASGGIPIGIERARCPAFRLKKRTVLSDNIATSNIEGVMLDLRIPDYIIDDKSYVSTYETETSIQSSMTESSFSETDVAAAGGASYMAFSGSASMSFAQTSSEAATNLQSKKTKKVTIAYNFPRVTVFLDSRSIELTPECSKALYDIRTEDDCKSFQDVYGEFFSTRVQLGGRLFATENVTGTSASSTSDMVKSMKIAAAASFSGWGLSADISASHGKGNESHESKESHKMESALTWQANGGDTLLCNQPLEWAPTVAYHWNWRITKQDYIASILDVASQIKGMSWIKDRSWAISAKTSNFDDAVAKPREISNSFARTFTLSRHLGDTSRFLFVQPATACNLAAVAQARNAAGWNHFELNSQLQTRGCVFLGPEQKENHQSHILYEAEDENGQPVGQVWYPISL